jgi:FO synthase subunit 1
MTRVITYSSAITLTITNNCANNCLYCGFRNGSAGVVSWDEIKKKAALARTKRAVEVLLISGEKADTLPSVRKDLTEAGFSSIAKFTEAVCRYLLENNLLPHINIGLLSMEDLRLLKFCSASMGLMLEGDYGVLSRRIQPQKIFKDRLNHLRRAGQLKIPFTTGLLLGIGESRKDRLRSIDAIAEVHACYGHIQEIILQPYRPSGSSSLSAQSIPLKEFAELVKVSQQTMPGVHLQVPPNLTSNWLDLLEIGFNDLGGIGFDEDVVNPGYPWPSIDSLKNKMNKYGYVLKERLPIYPEFIKKGLYSAEVGSVIGYWSAKRKYLQRRML